MDAPIKGRDIGNLTREYEYADGRKEHWVGGSKSWRNNNPGNIRDFNIPWDGLIGIDAEKFCIFNSYEQGKRAIRVDITTKAKRGLTLEQAIYAYAPPQDGNNTEKYIEHIVYETKISRDTPLSAVIGRIPDIVEVIQEHEGYTEGTIREVVQERIGKYIWRTQADKNVRLEHRMREGKVFDWESPPEGGHPGDAYGCRCWAEDINAEDASPVDKMFNSKYRQLTKD